MNTEISITLGIFAVLIGIALIFLKVEPGELRNHAHLSPGIALFRFGVWRYGMVAVLIVGGVVVISYSIS